MVDRIEFGGWKDNLHLSNGKTELVITLDVGPRVISYRVPDGVNAFKTFDEQIGCSGEHEWMSRGGHRFWLAPEDPVLSYLPDNSEFEYHVLSDLEVQTINAPNEQLPIQKVLTIAVDSNSSRVTVKHCAENFGDTPLQIATWGLSVMAAGGVEIIPLPPLGEHPRDLLPNRPMTLWPFTDMSDARYRWGRRFITVRQGNAGPTKFGLTHREGWVAYYKDSSLFVKTIEFREGVTYPDFGCNFETFTNEEMLEIEALGPLVELAPGDATEHTEQWQLFEGVSAPPHNEDEMAEWIAPFLP